MSDLLRNMFRRIAVKYGHPRPRSRARSRSSMARSAAESPVLDLSDKGLRSRSSSLKRRSSVASEDYTMRDSPEKQRQLVLPPVPEKSVGIYGPRRAAEDPFAAPDFLHTDNSFEFYVQRSGIWLKDSDLLNLFLMLLCLFLTSLLVAFTIGYFTLSTQMDSTDILMVDHASFQSDGQCGPQKNSQCQPSESEVHGIGISVPKSEMTVSQRREYEPEIGFDFSLATLGAKILTTRDTKPVAHYDATLLGYAIWSGLTSSDTQTDAPLQPILMPGRCWRFHDFPGNLVIQLAESIVVTSFALSHVLGASVPKSRLKSAPYEFEVWGLQEVTDADPHLFGNYSLSVNGPSNQEFPVINPTVAKMPIIELKVLSNYGSAEYTCVYRFKVFGIPQDDLLAQ